MARQGLKVEFELAICWAARFRVFLTFNATSVSVPFLKPPTKGVFCAVAVCARQKLKQCLNSALR